MTQNKELLIDMDVPSTQPSIIKVIGVGGGGGNAEIGRASCRERV